MHILLASKNQKKRAELEAILQRDIPSLCLHTLDEIGFTGEIVEDGTTFEENALIKARAAVAAASSAGRTDWYGLGDDSGLAVDALHGAPGLYSARYSGVKGEGRDKANNQRLLCQMQSVPDAARTARFVCTIALVSPTGEQIVVRGTCEGRILHAPQGEGGFGYDPLFFSVEAGKAFSELSAEEKNAVSHRGRAIAALADAMRDGHMVPPADAASENM